jgi:hypothetical protein
MFLIMPRLAPIKLPLLIFPSLVISGNCSDSIEFVPNWLES